MSRTEYFGHLRDLEDGSSVGEYQFTKSEVVDMTIRAVRHLIRRDFWLDYRDCMISYRKTGETIPTSPTMSLNDVFSKKENKSVSFPESISMTHAY